MAALPVQRPAVPPTTEMLDGSPPPQPDEPPAAAGNGKERWRFLRWLDVLTWLLP